MNKAYTVQISTMNETGTCFCIGPQHGEPMCPCRMRNLRQENGRWIEVIDHGPVQRETYNPVERPCLHDGEAAERIRDLEDRILLAKRLNYANYPGFVNPALNGEAIPQDILEYTDRICMEEGYVARVDK